VRIISERPMQNIPSLFPGTGTCCLGRVNYGMVREQGKGGCEGGREGGVQDVL